MKFIILEDWFSRRIIDAANIKTCFISKWISMYWRTTKKNQRIEKDPALNQIPTYSCKRTYD
jgi:hypothetical protein